jgi:hypothetical protein
MTGLGRASTLRDITTLYRAAFRVLSPELVARQAQRLCQLFFHGDFQVNVVEVRDQRSTVEYAGFTGFDRNLWLDFIGGSEAALSLTGAREIRTTIEAGGDGPTLRASAQWR